MSNEREEIATLIAGLPDGEPRTEWRALLEARLTGEPVQMVDVEPRAEWRTALEARLAQASVTAPVSALPDTEPSPAWRASLNARLEQANSADLVAALPDETPSMVWRSNVQEELIATHPAPKRRSRLRVLMPATGFAAAAALVVIALGPMRHSAAPVATDLTPEEQIVTMHFAQEFAVAEQVGVLSTPTSTTRADIQTVEWSDADLGAW